MAWHGMQWHGIDREVHGMVRHGMACNGMQWHGIDREVHGMVWHGLACKGMVLIVWCMYACMDGMAWCAGHPVRADAGLQGTALQRGLNPDPHHTVGAL